LPLLFPVKKVIYFLDGVLVHLWQNVGRDDEGGADMLWITLSFILSPFLSRFTGYPPQKDSVFDSYTRG